MVKTLARAIQTLLRASARYRTAPLEISEMRLNNRMFIPGLRRVATVMRTTSKTQTKKKKLMMIRWRRKRTMMNSSSDY